MRYARLYLNFLRFSFSRAMEFRVDFFFRIGMDTLWYAQQLAFFWVLYNHTPLLGGWTKDQALVFVTSLTLVDALHMTLFANNLWMFPEHVNRGDLDYYLVRPVSSLFFISLRDFAANSFVNLLMAIGLFSWAVARTPNPHGPLAVVGLVAAILVGVAIGYALHLIFFIPVFWLHSAEGTRQVYFSLSTLIHEPHRIFTGWARRTLTSVLPFAMVASYPVMLYFDGFPINGVAHLLSVAAGSFLFLLWFWGRGLRAYGSASS